VERERAARNDENRSVGRIRVGRDAPADHRQRQPRVLDRLDRSIYEGYLIAWAMLVHMHTRVHISAPVCSLFYKNWLSGTNVNQFSRPYTNHLREGNPHMVSSNTRHYLTRFGIKQEHTTSSSSSSSEIRLDQNLDLSIAAALSKERRPEQHDAVVHEVHALLGRDRLTGGAAVLAADAKHYRFKEFFSGASILRTPDCALVRSVKSLHASSKQNQGNNAHHRAATSDEVWARNEAFDKLVREGTYFWLPLTGVPDPSSIPDEGTTMAFGRELQVTVDGITAARRLSFKTVPPATFFTFVTHNALLNRFGGRAEKTLQKAKQATHVATYYPNHVVNCVRGQYLQSSKIKLEQLEFNLLLCYIVKRKNASAKKIKIEPASY
jgi:hypothetical protein